MLRLFRERTPNLASPRIGIAFAKMMGHHDDGYSMRDAPEDLQAHVKQEILRFGSAELAKLLFYVDDYGFDRPSNGYSLMSVLGARADSPAIFAEMRDDAALDQETRDKAAHLVAIHEHEPRWFGFWCSDDE